MKKCPYCAEEIQDEAIVCRYCKRDLTKKTVVKKKPTKKSLVPKEDLSQIKEESPIGESSHISSEVTNIPESKKMVIPKKLLFILLPLVVVIVIGFIYITNVSRNVAYYDWMIENKDRMSSNGEKMGELGVKLVDIGENMNYRARSFKLLALYTDPLSIITAFTHTEISDFSGNLEDWEKLLANLENIKTGYSKYHPTGLLANQYSAACSLLTVQISFVQKVISIEKYAIKSFEKTENLLQENGSLDAIITGTNYLSDCLAEIGDSSEVTASRYGNEMGELAKAYTDATDRVMTKYQKPFQTGIFSFLKHSNNKNENLTESSVNSQGISAGTPTNSSENQQIPQKRPEPYSNVNDFANVISPEYRNKINNLIDGKYADISVVTVNTTSPDNIETYASKLWENWDIGASETDVDNDSYAVLIIAAINDKKIRITVGSGLKEVLPDNLCGEIISQTMAPEFKQGNFGEGFLEAVQIIVNKSAGDTIIHSKIDECKADINLVRQALGLYEIDYDSYIVGTMNYDELVPAIVDQNGNAYMTLPAGNNWKNFSYDGSSNSYTITCSALDNKETLVTGTPNGVKPTIDSENESRQQESSYNTPSQDNRAYNERRRERRRRYR